MLHAKFQDHRTSGSREEDGFHIWAWRSSINLCAPLPKEAPHKI